MKRILAILFACLLLWGCAREERQQPTEPTERAQLPLPEVELTLWCPESYLGVMTREAERFAAAHAGEAVLTIHTEAMELSQVETRLYQDLDSGADLFVFSGSHLADMTRRGLLREVNDSMGAQKVLQPQAATVDGKLYGYPLGLTDGSVLYYNRALVSPQEVTTWDSLLSAAQKQGKQVQLDLNNPWYGIGFFAPHALELTYAEGKNSMTWDASAEGICREVAALACHPALCNAPDGLLLENGQKLCAAVSGMWCREDLRTLWGENFAVAALPRLENTPMGFFAIYDLLGVNAHSRQLYWAAAFARHLTGEDSLLMSGEGSADPVLQALTQQSQGGIIVPAGDNFWTPMSRLLGKLSSEAGEEPDWAALLAECADAMNK